VKLELLTSGTTLWVGHAFSAIRGGAVAGLMSGSAFGSRMLGLGGSVGSERTAVEYLPCVGTNGRWLRNSVSAADLGEAVRLADVVNKLMGDQGPRSAHNRGTSDIAKARFGDGDLVLTAIHGEGYVRRNRDGTYVRNARGTALGGIVVDGRRHEVPDPGESLLVPGVARVTPREVTRTNNGIRVSAVKVELLRGTEVVSTLYLGNVRLRVTKATG
jgi:hypothetical protein